METSILSFRGRGLCVWAVVTLLASLTATGRAEGFLPESTGLRLGLATSPASTDFHQAEAFADWNLPWKWDLGAQWGLQTRLDGSAGWFGRQDVGAGIFGVGPLLSLGRKNFPVYVQAGVSATVLTRTQFTGKDFGEPLQFVSYAGVYWDFMSHFRLGCRFQHMSNAHLSDHNPGINFVLFGLSYVF